MEIRNERTTLKLVILLRKKLRKRYSPWNKKEAIHCCCRDQDQGDVFHRLDEEIEWREDLLFALITICSHSFTHG